MLNLKVGINLLLVNNKAINPMKVIICVKGGKTVEFSNVTVYTQENMAVIECQHKNNNSNKAGEFLSTAIDNGFLFVNNENFMEINVPISKLIAVIP